MSLAIAATVLTGVQAIGQIQNARFQADLVEKQNKDRLKQAGFAATETELELERARLNLAIEERDRMRESKKTIGKLIAKPLTVDINPVYQSHLADLAEDLMIIKTDAQIMTKKSQAGIYNLMASTYAQNSVDTTAAKVNRQAAYISAVSTMSQGYLNYQYLKPSSATGASKLTNTNKIMGGTSPTANPLGASYHPKYSGGFR